jgi:hypothetical protein
VEQLSKFTGVTAALLSVLIGVTVLFVHLPHKHGRVMKAYLTVMAIMEIIAYVTAKTGNNLYLFHINAFCEITLLAAYFYYYIFKGSELRFIKIGSIYWSVIALILVVINFLAYSSIPVSMTINSITILTFSLVSFFLLLGREEEDHINVLFINTVFLMHGVSIMILFFSTTIFTFPAEKQYIIFFCRLLIFVFARGVLLSILLYRLWRQLFANSKNSLNES